MSRKSLFLIVAAAVLLAVPAVLLAIPAADFEGRPTFEAGKSFGAYIWHDDAGFHIRYNTKEKERHFHGKICTDKILKLDGYHVADNPKNKVEISADKKCIEISLYTDKALNGFDWFADGKKMEFRLKVDEDSDLKATAIFYGAKGTNPATSPFTMDR